MTQTVALLGSLPSPKTVVLERMDTHQSTIIQIQLDLTSQTVDLSSILTKHCPQHAHRLQIYDPITNTFLRLKTNANRVDRTVLDPAFLLLRYNPKETSQRIGSTRQGRSKERTIGQAIELVRQWRALHQTFTRPQNKRKKVSLPQAASMLGVSKKSLDDYYCQLRIGEQHGFDFQAHLQDGIGVLRAFAKQKRQQAGKHPKVLRVIEDLSFMNLEDPPKESSSLQEEISPEQTNPPKEKTVEGQRECLRGSHEGCPAFVLDVNQQKLISNLQLEYYRGFEYLLDEPVDPFLDLARNFSVHLSDEESHNIFFY